MSSYTENEAGENICVDKVVELSLNWTEAECGEYIKLSVSAILKKWAESHSDEYDQPYYSIIMSPNIHSTLREYYMLEKWREKRFSDARFKKANLASWKSDRERCSSILNNTFCTVDGNKMLDNKLTKLYQVLVELYKNESMTYAAFRNSSALKRFDEMIRYVNGTYSTFHRLELREKKANLEKQRVEFLQNRLNMEIYKYAVNN